jgi:hypothetical protein
MDRVFVGMEGIVVDFDAIRAPKNQPDEPTPHRTGTYLDAPPVIGAIEALRQTVEMGYDVFLTVTLADDAAAVDYSDTAAWVSKRLPDFKQKLIISGDKGLLGDAGDILLDARPQAANAKKFRGTILRFIDGYHWPQALLELARRSPANNSDVLAVIGVGDHQQALRNLRSMTSTIAGLQARIVQAEFGLAHRGKRAWSGVEVRLVGGDVLTILDKATCEEGIILDREGAMSSSVQLTLSAIEHANDITGGNDRGDLQLLSELFVVPLERVFDVIGAIWHAVHSREEDPSITSWDVRAT